MQARQTSADPRLRDGRWRSALAECLALYRAVTGDISQSRPLQPTDLVAFGPYTVVGLIGQGGMGRVYSARAADGTRVAIKALIAHAAARDAALPRFQRELAAARRIEGELTARVVDADLEADPPWLATEYIQGPTLTAVVGALGPLPPPAVAALAMGIGSALMDIHAAGVVHRDLKPSNILLAPDGLRVVDFGIARTSDGTTLTGQGWTLGTPAFMAPEQVVGRPVEPQADVFALGSVLVYAATGEPPFGSDEATTVMYRTVHDAPNLERVSGPLRALVEDCLEKDPADRPTPNEVIDRAYPLLGPDPARTEFADESVHTAETIITPVLDPVQPQAEPVVVGEEAARQNPEILSHPPGNKPAFDETASTETTFTETAFAETAPVDKAASVDETAPLGSAAPDQAQFYRMPPKAVAPEANPFAEPATDDGLASVPPPVTDTASHLRRFIPRGRNRVIVGTALGVVLVAAATIAALAANHQNGNSQQTGGGLSIGAVPSTSATPVAPRKSAKPSNGLVQATLPGSFLAGPGCAASPWTDTARSIPAADGFVPNVTGGDPECGGIAAAFKKSGSTAPTNDGFTWQFHLRRAARCTLSIYIANIDASSGAALYELTTADGTTRFTVNQSPVKGQWVQPGALHGLELPDGILRLRLTDASSYTGERFHVTASAVRADCS